MQTKNSIGYGPAGGITGHSTEDGAGSHDTARRGDFGPLFAGAAVGIAGVGAVLSLADLSSVLRAPFTIFFLIAAPATAVAAALGRLDPLSRTVVAGAAALALDLLVAQAMLALHIWSARGGVVAVAAISAAVLLLTRVRRRRGGGRPPRGRAE